LNRMTWKRYFLDGMPSYVHDLITNQVRQAWVRLIICLVGSIYLFIHAVDLPAHFSLLMSIGIGYIGLQIHTLLNVKKRPLSFIRIVITPIFDIVFLSTAILVDGGQFSPLYLFYFVTILGNGMRFGNRMLVYSQILSVIAFSLTCLYLLIVHQTALDIPVFIIQMLTLLILPRYSAESNSYAHDAIHAKKQAESASFQLLDNSPIAAFTFQYDDHQSMCINYVNRALQKMAPSPLEELVGYPIQALFSSDDIHEVEDACHSVLKKEQEDAVFYIRTQGKQHHTLQLLGNVRCFDLHHVSVGICFLTDITQQQEGTLKMQKNMQEGYMSTLVAGIVHDFRNVLTSIMGTAEMMQFMQEDLQEKSKESLQVIEDLELIIQASEQGSRMITDLLRLGKASQSEEQAHNSDIVPALKSMINLLRIQLPESIPLTLHTAETLPNIGVQLTQLEQVLMNLIKNSAESSPKGGAIDVHINTEKQASPNEAQKEVLKIQVLDHGVGIAKEDLSKVTQAFWTSRQGSGGTGLGLAMVQRIVRQHHGQFHIDSILGKGTCITLTFPILDKAASMPVQQTNKHLPSADNQHIDAVAQQNWHILLIDDNPDVLHVHQSMLERMGHQVTTANDGKEALEIVAQEADAFDPHGWYRLLPTYPTTR